MMMRLLARIKKLNTWQIALIIALVGVAVFFTGLNNPFQGDDDTQIVNNIVVHSVSHIDVLFNGSTFYNGGSVTTPLLGTYYRPMMMVCFSIIYSIFGAHPLYFHIFQMLVVIANAIIIYLIFQKLFRKKLLALALALIFLVHPLSSQVVFAIPSLQDALFFFFGSLALLFLIKYESLKGMWLAAFFLLLSLLSKETGMFFVIICLLYLFFYNREHVVRFAKIISLPVLLWIILKAHAVGLVNPNPHMSPIDQLSLLGRLMNVPAIILFYLSKLIFPWELATQYHWAYSTFSVEHVLLPLIIDLAVFALVVVVGKAIRQQAPKLFISYLFFAIWVVLGMSVYMQIIPLDMTVCENWFYFSMAGVLGMVGVAISAFKPRIRPGRLLIIAVLIIGILGVRTAIRGTDYSSVYKLCLKDVTVSKEDFKAYTGLSQAYFKMGNYDLAKSYAEKSIEIFPDMSNYQNLGAASVYQGDYDAAYAAYNTGLKYGNYSQLLGNLAELTLVHGTPVDNQKFFATSLKQYPNDPYLWIYYALQLYRAGHTQYAKAAATNALTYSKSIPLVDGVYNSINKGEHFYIIIGTKKVPI